MSLSVSDREDTQGKEKKFGISLTDLVPTCSLAAFRSGCGFRLLEVNSSF